MNVHASTRILLLLLAMTSVVGGLWVLFSVNAVIVAIAYGVIWTIIVLVATRLVLTIGSGYNRFRDGGARAADASPADPAAALAQLADLRARDLISPDEYEAKRATILKRL